MGKESDKKSASPYVVLENRPLDQWKVTELKEELKKRELPTRGLKEELVKRLDGVVRAEMDEAKKNLQIELDNEAQPEVQSDDVAEEATGVVDRTGDEKTDVEMGLDTVHTGDGLNPLAEKTVTDGEGGSDFTQIESVKVVEEISVEATTTTTTNTVFVSEESGGGLNQQATNGESKLEEQVAPGSSDLISGDQVVEVSKVQSESISIDTVTNNEKNEIKDNVIADDVKLELDVKPSKSESVEIADHDMDEAPAEENNVLESLDVVEVSKVQSDSVSIDTVTNIEKDEIKDDVSADDVKLEINVQPSKSEFVDDHHMDEAPAEEKNVTESIDGKNHVVADDVKVAVGEEKDDNNDESVVICKKNDSGDMESAEKLNLDRSSGDESMEEDGLESKQTDLMISPDEVGDTSEKIEVKEDEAVHVSVEGATGDKNVLHIEDKTGPGVTSIKRKPHDQEAAEKNETIKRQRRWNTEGVKVPEQHSANHSTSTTPKDAFQTPTKRTFSRAEPTAIQEMPKERVVPPSLKSPTNSLRIDHFLRPFTLKAVQELLGKTGTVVSFWMDQIKTHCYVSYASEEEAIETRNALCNLQWPVNGGRLLMADFVDPQEVKDRINPPPPPSPIPPTATVPPVTTMQPPQPSPRQKQPLPPPPSLPPPPPLSAPPTRTRALSPPPEKIEPPMLTLDDLFKKTRATPRIYYLPLSDEQVAAKLSAQGKPMKQ
ncbi:uncharacterized protein [Rutidosis leptorrhynchoides]|uniref:uncharacterized protein n=1 Tax=Rutidosis leptorrhynchoides TaxID=125765 RepID=UPI003A9A008A